jgi:uncharacterized protein YjbJ (UPF0337 family)
LVPPSIVRNGIWEKRDEYPRIEGDWRQSVGKAKEKWGRLKDDDWKVIEGKRDQLIG